MTFDVVGLINSVHRSVHLDRSEGQPRQTIKLTRRCPGTINELWSVLTDPQHISTWFLPISGDLSVGGRFQLEGNASGTLERCDQNLGFRTSWEFGEQISQLEVALVGHPDGCTTVRLRHSGHNTEEFWQQYGPGATGVGWEQAFLGLAQYTLRDEQPFVAETITTWLASEDGKRFVKNSCDAWADAAIAAGEDESQARAAAERTLQFYCP